MARQSDAYKFGLSACYTYIYIHIYIYMEISYIYIYDIFIYISIYICVFRWVLVDGGCCFQVSGFFKRLISMPVRVHAC